MTSNKQAEVFTKLHEYIAQLTIQSDPVSYRLGKEVDRLLGDHDGIVSEAAAATAVEYMAGMGEQIASASQKLLDIVGSMDHTVQALHLIRSKMHGLIANDPEIMKAMKELDATMNLRGMIRSIVNEELTEASDVEHQYKDSKDV